MPTAVVTGALGRIGRWTVEEFADAGYDVVALDRERPDGGRDGVHFYQADLTDQGQTWELVTGAEPDVVAHLAAIPAMGVTSGTETFLNNVECAYNVLVAAGEAGADVAWTSSECIYGMVFADETWLPEYLPVDEAHPLRPEDPYGTSKEAGEAVARMVARDYGVAVSSVRPSWTQVPGEYYTREAREAFDPADADELNFDYWSYVDARDVASMLRLAVEERESGHEAYGAVADENYLDRPTAEVIEQVAGELPEECDLSGDESAFTTEKATRDLGWEPAHSWRTAEDEEPPELPF
ncbi:MAG: NAD-dependent epimerase/dehydratase family protein [Halobacteriaceae archaeon]